MTVAALLLTWVGLALVVVGRVLIQRHRHGDTGLRAGMLAARPGSMESVAGWVFVLGFVAVAVNPVLALLGLERLWRVPGLEWAGFGLAVVGLAATFGAQLAMGPSWRIGVDATESTDLVTTGVFGIVRNPIFSAMTVVVLGLTLALPTVVSVAALVTTVVSVQMQVRWVEEPYLVSIHGEAYRRYCGAVGRFLPGVGRGEPDGKDPDR